jgi:hypothetical protein
MADVVVPVPARDVVVPVPAREKKRVFGRPSSVLPALPPLRLVLGDVPIPDPDGRRNSRLEGRQKLDPEIESTVKRLIAHLKDEK